MNARGRVSRVTGFLHAGGVIAGAVGGEMVVETEATRKFFAHPGEIAAAQRFVVAAQKECKFRVFCNSF